MSDEPKVQEDGSVIGAEMPSFEDYEPGEKEAEWIAELQAAQTVWEPDSAAKVDREAEAAVKRELKQKRIKLD